MEGIPSSWLHASDELYNSLRGPGKKMKVLATAEQSKDNGGSGRQEPVLMVIKYGKGRIFHTTMGHQNKDLDAATLCTGFLTTTLRGAEWSATGKVTQKISRDFPDSKNTTIWSNLKPSM